MLIIMAYIADCLRRKTIQGREDAKYGQHSVADGDDAPQQTAKAQKDLSHVSVMKAIDFYEKLLPLEAGQAPERKDE